MEPTNVVIPRIGNGGGRIAFGAGDRHQTAVSLQVHIHAGPIAARAVVTITRHADINDSRIELFNRRKIELEPAHDASAEIFDYHICDRGELEREFLSAGVFKVDADRAFAAV